VHRGILLTLAAAASLLAGCGGPEQPRSRADHARPPASGGPPLSGRPDDVRVIRRWADTLRAGDVAGAARLFAVPAIVENGTPPQLLKSRREVRAFNASLPCGARLLRTRRRDRYTVAVFRLTERPGGACGRGVGETAATAFRLRGGRIAEWLRVPTGPGVQPLPKPPAVAPPTSSA